MSLPRAALPSPGAIGAVVTRARGSKTTSIACTVLAAVLVLAVFGRRIAPTDPREPDLSAIAVGASPGHLLGTDQTHRDVPSRTLVGATTAVLGPLVIALFVVVVATALGVLSGYRGGRLDAVILRTVDVLYSLPPLLVAIIVVGALGGGYMLAIAVIAVFSLPPNVRALRAATLEQRSLPYVESARTLGLSQRHIMVRHILPNVVPVIISTGFVRFTFAFVDLTTLSFLGVGVSPDTPDWGRMLADSQILVFENPAAALAPLVMIVLTTVSANLAGEAAHDSHAAAGRAR